ncbi:hypothetical protein CSB45_10120 [candidate division KSB3 bacterium]|uniref:Uncharacterized protein n=1 Tax=candidate division KSB3 bacterium TaxID=2044937 RepID=A0A2G6E3Z8_9BACT|nr:MAG: hypothetical protein CSB45_10120 [candidate division KSB3 bacterium]PIE29330.1 MAG: hypothetical protein CSA57_08975 [candidate division KSB3 bacterium]
MPPFVDESDISDAGQIVEHFQSIPDITEYILESDLYPSAALKEAQERLENFLERGELDGLQRSGLERTISRIERVLSTRVDYVLSIIDSLTGNAEFAGSEFSLDESPTKEILIHIDLMKDVVCSPRIHHGEYKNALQKFIKTLKFRFNKGLEIHKRLYHLQFEELAENRTEYPKAVLEEQQSFLEDALAMTRSHIPVKPVQIHQLKETLFKILESTGVRILQSKRINIWEEYAKILKKIETLFAGLEVDFGQKVVDRFADMLPEYIADHRNFCVIKHNRKVVELLIDHVEDAALLSDLYRIFINLVSAEAVQSRKKHELIAVSLKDVEGMSYVLKNDENALHIQMKMFRSLDMAEQARELIRLSVYGLCDYILKIPQEELKRYPIGILKSTEKMLKDLNQHRLRESESQRIRDFSEYKQAIELLEEALFTYDPTAEKYNFVDIYKESDYRADGIIFCAFNDILLRLIQNIKEAYFFVDSDEKRVSENRLYELKVTIIERYKSEWKRQNELRQASDQQAMEELAAELL